MPASPPARSACRPGSSTPTICSTTSARRSTSPVPEILEIESYRELAARTIGREVRAVDAPDAWFLKQGLDAEALASALIGHRVDGARRIGKLLLVDLHGAPTLGLRFGMTGRLVVDGATAID